MQLTSPFFLFLFFPISLPLVLLLPKAARRISLSLISVLWFVLANVRNPLGLAHVALLIFFATILAYLPLPRRISVAKTRTVLGISLPIATFLAARILTEYFPQLYIHPTGLLFITLSIVSYFIDAARGDTVLPRNPLELIGYFLFFPTLTVGPILRSKLFFDLTEQIAFTPEGFTRGIRRYMTGFVKCLAVAAVFLRGIRDILSFSALGLHPLSYLFLLVFSFLGFYFAFTGSADIAVGLSAMYGLELPRDRSRLLLAAVPHRVLYGTFLSMRSYLLDYIRQPLRRRLPATAYRLLCTVLFFVITLLALRTRPEMLLLALPVLLTALLALLPPFRKRCRIRRPLWRMLLTPLSALSCSFFTLGFFLEKPMGVLQLARAALGSSIPYQPHYVLGMIQDGRYLALLSILLLLMIPYPYLRRLLCRKWGDRATKCFVIAETVLIFAAFVLTIVFFMPQFPQYAVSSIFRM